MDEQKIISETLGKEIEEDFLDEPETLDTDCPPLKNSDVFGD